MPPARHTIQGRVIDRVTGEGVVDAVVRLYAKGGKKRGVARETRTQEGDGAERHPGAFKFTVSKSDLHNWFGAAHRPKFWFTVKYKGKLVADRADTPVWQVGRTEEDIKIHVATGKPPRNGDKPANYLVRGHVSTDQGVALSSVKVVAVDKHVGGEDRLGEEVTDPDGSYRILYGLVSSKEKKKQRPDIQIKAISSEDGGEPLAISNVRYNAGQEETINVIVPSYKLERTNEFEIVTSELALHLDGQTARGAGRASQFGQLREDEQRQDITYLANKSGWDARMVAMIALAHQFTDKAKAGETAVAIRPELFYALFRAGLPANEPALFQTNAKTVKALWELAIAQGVISTTFKPKLSHAIKQYQKLSAKRALDSPAVIGASSLKDMLTVSLGDDSQKQERFAEIYTQLVDKPAEFWSAVRGEFGEELEMRLKLDGQLAYLTLNNAPLIRRLHQASGHNGLKNSLDLVASGYYRTEQWLEVMADDPVPPSIPGDNDAEKRGRYAELLAAQLRLSFPTAIIGQMVKSGETPLLDRKGQPIPDDVVNGIHGFLSEHQGQFEIGRQPVEQYLARNDLQIDKNVMREVTRIQRVYQITPSDNAMNALLKKGVESAYAVVRYDRDEFVRAFKSEVGGEANARSIHARAQQVHNTVLNLAVSYLTASNAPGVGVHSPGQILDPEPAGPDPHAPNATDVIAYSTLESLFGEMDYCDCQHCRSILSPAAYLVDLLLFLDRTDDQWTEFLADWKADHGGAPYPYADQAAWDTAGQPNDSEVRPLQVLLSRRPDIQHLPLTCENTNTPLPYIDLVNEALEYYVADNRLSLAGYVGHNTDNSATPEELLANPQYVRDEAYATLAGAHFPPPLPFHRPLEYLRRYCDKFEAPLPRVMEALRENENIERPDPPADPARPVEFGWRDILMEEVRLSRAEYRLLTDHTLTLQQLYGYSAETLEADVLDELSNAKAFTRRVGLSYEDLIEVLKTRFVNPNSTLIPRLERLGVPISTLKALKDNKITDEEFDDALAPHLDVSQYGGDVKAWVKNQDNYDRIMGLITLANPVAPGDDVTLGDLCSFEELVFRYANPSKINDPVRPFEFLRLIRFIRLWKKLGWTIEQTDKAITALYPPDQAADDPDDAINVLRLDKGFLTLLPRLGVVARVIDILKLNPKKDLLPLLACFAPIDVHGAMSFYRQMFLRLSPQGEGGAFADDGYGNYLEGPEKLVDHTETLRAAFVLTEAELAEINDGLGYDADTLLTVDNISSIFRRGWLARKLRLSVREFHLLTKFADIDPFATPDPPDLPILRLIDFVHRLRAASLKPAQALYLIWNQDISGRSAPEGREVPDFSRILRSELNAIETDFALVADPDGQIAYARMALVYGNDATEAFFGLLNESVSTDVAYTHDHPTLEQAILDVGSGHIAFDNLRKRLSYSAGVMSDSTRDDLKAVAGVTQAFKDAVDELHQKTRIFFDRYLELLPLFDAYVASNEPAEKKRSDLLENFLPELKRRRKRQHAVEAVSAAARSDTIFASAVLGNSAVLHRVTDPARPALDDFIAIETVGLSAEFFFRETATGAPDQTSDTEANLAYAADGENELPRNPTGPQKVSAIWRGYLEAPENGPYGIRVEAEPNSTVTLEIAGAQIAMVKDGHIWSNNSPIELNAGRLHAISIRAENIKDIVDVRWESAGRGWETIPARYLYSAVLVDRSHRAYVRFLKTASLARVLKLTPSETAYLGSRPEYQIGGQGWFNSLPVSGTPDTATSVKLFAALEALLDFSTIKSELSPDDERFLAILQDPAEATRSHDSLLFTMARWKPASLNALLSRFNKSVADLAELDSFRRLHEAHVWVGKLKIPAAGLIVAVTNEPNAATVRNLRSALRARYDENEWLDVLRPINDAMRGVQRDALVAHILHHMRSHPASRHIDTPEKLFEYFLMDVRMESCMLTSRIRHALSSVQLFIERCLMNLEPRVAPSSISAKQWEWMSRYRVWEANRKVFLFPENWLEPELRDDQSPFFKEAMSELLQSDITEDRASMALLNYLSKLEEVAKLELCGMHYAESNSTTDPGSDTVHIVARTAGGNRKYFYRRREYGVWTPWEQIKLDIEDNPVTPVVWKGRLFLFWLRILQQAPLTGEMPFSASGDLTALTTSDINTGIAKITIQAVLCWSEYCNGKWQPVKTSDVNRPTTLTGEFDPSGDGAFNRSIHLSVSESGSALKVTISGQGTSWFVLYNTHSLPVRREDDSAQQPAAIDLSGRSRSLDTSQDTLTINYGRGVPSLDGTWSNVTLPRPVFRNKTASGDVDFIVPCHPLGNVWDAPFFYEDSRHVFYVTTTEQIVQVPDWENYIVAATAAHETEHLPPLMVREEPRLKEEGERAFWAAAGTNPGVVDPAPMGRFVSEDAYISKGIGAVGSVSFGDREIGPAGSLAYAVKR